MNYAEFAGPPLDSYFPFIQELLTYDATALDCCDLVRDQTGIYCYRTLPSSLHWSRQTEWPWAIQASFLEPHHTCLEVGGAGCVMKYPVAKKCKHVVIADVNVEDMRHTAEAVSRLGFSNITQVLADARALPYPSDWFDRVYCISVLEHISDYHELAVEQMVNVLKPGGVLMLSMDVVLEGQAGVNNNFYLDVPKALRVLGALGIEQCNARANYLRGRFEKEGITLGVILAKYTKPEA